MLPITATLSLDESELDFRFVRAPGPGGQNVNKVSSAVELRFDVARSPSLPDDVKARLAPLAGHRLSADGILTLDAHRFRTQAMNRRDAIERLVALIAQAAVPPKPRKATKPSRGAKEARLQAKRRDSGIKRARRERHTLD